MHDYLNLKSNAYVETIYWEVLQLFVISSKPAKNSYYMIQLPRHLINKSLISKKKKLPNCLNRNMYTCVRRHIFASFAVNTMESNLRFTHINTFH